MALAKDVSQVHRESKLRGDCRYFGMNPVQRWTLATVISMKATLRLCPYFFEVLEHKSCVALRLEGCCLFVIL